MMAIGNGYATLAELKSRLDIHMADHDVNLEQMIESASTSDRWLDGAHLLPRDRDPCGDRRLFDRAGA